MILADEPTSGLDEANTKNVLELLDSIRLQTGVTMIIASHSQSVFEFATQIITISGGIVYDDKRNH